MVIGHQRIINFFKKGIAQKRLAHAFLFVGPAMVGKRQAATEIAKIILCQASFKNRPCGKCPLCLSFVGQLNADVIVVEPEQDKQQITIKQIRDAQRVLSLSPYLASSKVLIVPECQLMTNEASSALLKTLEEPPPRSYIILTSSFFRRVLPTIVSRCQIIKFNLVPVKEIVKALKAGNAQNLALRSGGRPALAAAYAENQDLLKEDNNLIGQFNSQAQADFATRLAYAEKLSADPLQARRALEKWQIFLRDKLLTNLGVKKLALLGNLEKGKEYDNLKITMIMKKIDWTRQRLSMPGFNLKLAMEELLLQL